MKRLRLKDLDNEGTYHILEGIVPGKYLTHAGLSFKPPGFRTHDVGCTCPSCDGHGKHIHQDDREVFIVLHGKARMEVDGESYDMVAGDVIICEAGEDHHLVSDENHPCVNIFMHAGDHKHPSHEKQSQSP